MTRRCSFIGCKHEAEYEIWEDRQDMHPAEGFTDSCHRHIGELLGTVKEEGCPWRWVIQALAGAGEPQEAAGEGGKLMAFYRKKPVIIEAFRNETGHPVQISTLEGVMTANPGDWIITGVKGERYPCKPDIFEATYEPVIGESEEPVSDSEQRGTR